MYRRSLHFHPPHPACRDWVFLSCFGMYRRSIHFHPPPHSPSFLLFTTLQATEHTHTHTHTHTRTHAPLREPGLTTVGSHMYKCQEFILTWLPPWRTLSVLRWWWLWCVCCHSKGEPCHVCNLQWNLVTCKNILRRLQPISVVVLPAWPGTHIGSSYIWI